MGRHANLPHHIYVNVRNLFLGPAMPEGVTKGIWHAVYAREGQAILCHVVLETGAHWSGLPLHALSATETFEDDWKRLMPWGCMGSDTEAWHAAYLEGLPATLFREGTTGRHTGIVLDWSDGFSRYPQEHKPLNLIATQAGPFALVPNNYMLVEDKHFTGDSAPARLYKRGSTVYWEG